MHNQQSLLLSCQEQFKTTFNNPDLLLQALRHSSYANEQKESLLSNERLEFLGDAVLDIVIVEYLYHRFPDYSEGQLTRIKANLVCEPTLAKIAQHLHIGQCLLLNKGEERDGGRNKPAILADAVEAVIGALYLDQGLEAAKNFIFHMYEPFLHELFHEDQLLYKDAKSRLNECRQKAGKTLPTYSITREWGEDHAKMYEVGIFFDDDLIATGTGHSKKEASQDAAQKAYQGVCTGKIYE
ncbi:ribonuclease III [Spirochaetales bacterium BR208]|uniref:Ribonuclease 3 n=1 Tax=Entomospira nematocerorum TaxID=2719987 RepID=A0A968KSY1_9SPIO|nr:ribonuclease III [Entomospira nematocera]